jgi:sigma-B regulation protein RsbQ
MTLQQRHNVHIFGNGPTTMIFSHGFGCDQTMWRYMVEPFMERFTVVLHDLIGSGRSDLNAYDPARYETLAGYADDLSQLIDAYGNGPVILVGHSVSAMIGVLSDLAAPGRVAAHVMVGPSPCYIDGEGYVGGFSQDDIHALLDTLDSNYLGWASSMAPAIMGAPGQPALAEELTQSFCSTRPDIAKQFARVTFLSDNREDVARLTTPALILQASDDLIAPIQVGEYLNRAIVGSTLCVVDNIGHCPHMSAPSACVAAMEDFLDRLGSRDDG